LLALTLALSPEERESNITRSMSYRNAGKICHVIQGGAATPPYHLKISPKGHPSAATLP